MDAGHAYIPRCPCWVARLAVGADIVARNGLYEVLKRLFVARLLAFAEEARHDHAGRAECGERAGKGAAALQKAGGRQAGGRRWTC